jgi:hypothetical protein
MLSAKLQLQNADLRTSLQARPHPDDDPLMAPSLQETVTLMLFDRSQNPQSKKKIDDLLKNIAFVLLSYSFTGYEFLKRYIPLPCRNTIYAQFIPRIVLMQKQLTECGEIASILQKRQPFVYCSVALDAISLDNYFIGRSIKKKCHPNAFVFHGMPLTTEERCFPLHVMPNKSGSATDDVKSRIMEVLHSLSNSGIQVLFVATDGDPGYQKFHDEQFTIWESVFREFGFEKACEEVLKIRSSQGKSFFITDFLHLVKTIRNRLLKYILAFLCGDLEFTALWTVIDEYFHLGPVFSDDTGVGKMRDAYAIALFRLEYVIELFKRNAFAEALVLLPWSLMFICFRSPGLSNATRLFILELVAHLLFHFLDQDNLHLPEQGPVQSKVRAFKKSTLKRGLNTVIGLASALMTYGSALPLDRLTTHPLENFFGLMRRLLHDCNSYEEVLRAMARNSVINEVFIKLHHPLEIAQRANLSGVVADPADHLELLPGFPPTFVLSKLIEAAQIARDPEAVPDATEIDSIDAVFDWLRNLHELTATKRSEKEKDFTIRASANSKIMASLVQKRTRERAHAPRRAGTGD